jgi:hypothetical protein
MIVTLSVLWRSYDGLHIASDSRMSFSTLGHADIGVKVMRLPIRVIGTDLDKHGSLIVLFERTYGFSYAGSLANAATFKQFIEDLLLDVQYVSQDVPLSFDELCRFLCHFCEKVSTEVVASLTEAGRYTFCVAGLCPQSKRLHGARFDISQANGRSQATFEEVAAVDGEYVALGTGAAQFESTIAGQAVTKRNVLLAVNRVIDQKSISTVGGDIQYGSFDNNGNFTIYGLIRISVEEAEDEGKHYGPSKQRAYRYRGFDLYEGWRAVDDRFWPSPTFIELDVPSNADSSRRFVERCRRTSEEGS